MSFLYIVGNGFDLWHNLPTRYADFCKFVVRERYDFEQYFNFKVDRKNYLWTDFEADLASFDWIGFYSDHNHIDVQDESFRPSMLFCLEDDLKEQADDLVNSIKNAFENWIESIEIDQIMKRADFKPTDRFLTFNYTLLLKEVYCIEVAQILHIHGDVSNYNIKFGHNGSMEEIPEIDEDGESNRTPFSDSESAAKYPFYALQKPVKEIINENMDFFKSLQGIDTIVILGHSLNEIDLPYFKEIFRFANCKRCLVSYYCEEESESHYKKLLSFKIEPQVITMFEMDELQNILKD